VIGNTVSLDDSFGASSVHAKLSVLIIIASAFRSHLTDLMTATDRDGAPPEGMQMSRVDACLAASTRFPSSYPTN
jgi:hypothetical protein